MKKKYFRTLKNSILVCNVRIRQLNRGANGRYEHGVIVTIEH